MNLINCIPAHGDGVDELFLHSDGRWWGRDEHGEFPLLAGSPHPVSKGDWNVFKEKELRYYPCNRVLKFTFERYGERRWCTGISSNEDDTCKHHKHRLAMEEQQEKNFKTGAFTKSYDDIFEYLPPHKKVLANEIFRSLIEESVYDFGESFEDREIETHDWDEVEGDTATIMHPVPQQHEARCMALWFASLDFVVMQNIRMEQFKVAAQEGNAVGEKRFEQESESGEVYVIIDEHHLNLTLSRVQKDYKEHMKFGGVPSEIEADKSDSTAREWVVSVTPDDGAVKDDRHEDEMLSIDIPDED